MAWPFSRRKTVLQRPDTERVWIDFQIDRGAGYDRIQYRHQNMDAMAMWLPMLVADAMLCNFDGMPSEGSALLRDIEAFATEKRAQVTVATTNQAEFNALRLASRPRNWAPMELSDDTFGVLCEIDASGELERIKVMTPFTPPDAAEPRECQELIWIAWDWLADGSGLHPGRAAMGATHLLMFAAVIDEIGRLPTAHDRGIVPWIVMNRSEAIAREAWGEEWMDT